MAERYSRVKAQPPEPACQTELTLRIDQVLPGSVQIPIKAVLLYDSTAPLTVSVTFHPGDKPPITWYISRELLYWGLFEASGTGDVRLWPSTVKGHDVVHMLLECDGESALFILDRGIVKDWLDDTYDLVGSAEELAKVDWDAVVSQLINGS
ncbi:SsgA family sporulation/cell division regulator [Streptomyces sp. 049-1]|uniref:SsgA family sporulation/cell division regulator n=1 Tax=Streptomyces sp. 049-1 TaxID=2789264 RepID=UPI0039803A14